MTVSHRPNTPLVAAVLAFLAGAAIFLAGIRLASGTPPPPDPVVLADHATASPCLDAGVPLVNPPPMVLRPSWWARARATARDVGRNTGGAPLVFAVGGVLVLVRQRWPGVRRGWVGRFTAGCYAAAIWAGGSLQLGATWATALTGVVVALVTGAAWAAVPGEGAAEKPASADGAA